MFTSRSSVTLSVQPSYEVLLLLPKRIKGQIRLQTCSPRTGTFRSHVSGHSNLNYFQTRIGLWGDQRCRFCHGNNETAIHLLTDCPSFWASRRDFFCDKLPNSDMSWSVRTLLEFSYIPPINSAFEGTWAHGDPLDIDDMDTVDAESSLTDDSPSE